MMKAIFAATVLTVATASHNATAFAPTMKLVPRSTFTQIHAEDKKNQPVTMDMNFDEVDIVRLLGLKKVKRRIRKNKRKSEKKGN